MNLLLWIFQILLALHTVMGAVWKFSNSAQTVGALKMIPHTVWMGMSGFELLCSLALVAPAFNKRWGILAPIAAACIAAEMLTYAGLFLYSGDTHYNQLIYWLVVAVFAVLLALGRFMLKPIC